MSTENTGQSGWDLYGPNLGRSKTDPYWDAIHVLAPGERERTLCGLTVDEVASACSMDTGYKPGLGNGCWTCLEASNRWASKPVPPGEPTP